MKRLHILRSQPTPLVRQLVDEMSKGDAKREVPLYQGPVDYAKLVKDIFEHDQVTCWW